MKSKWLSKILTGLFVVSLVFGTTSLASAKGTTGKKAEQSIKKAAQTGKTKKEAKPSGKKQVKKAADVKSKVGKTVEDRLNSSDSSIKNITASINSYFGVSQDGTVNIQLSKTAASKVYNSYKGKLNAEINKLLAIDKQLASYKKKNNVNASEYDTLINQSKALQQLAANEINQVKLLAENASTPTTDPSSGSTGDQPATTDPSSGSTGDQPATTDPSSGSTGDQPATTDPSSGSTGDQPATTDPSSGSTGDQPATADPTSSSSGDQTTTDSSDTVN